MSTDDDMSGGPGEDRLLVSEHALGLLDAAAHRRMGERIAADPSLAAELRFWQSRLAGLDGEFEPARAPANIFSRIRNSVFGGPERKTGVGAIWHSLAMWRSLAAVSFAVAAFAVTFSLMQPERLDPGEFATQLVAALQAQEGSGVEFVALYDAATGSVRLTALSGTAVPEKDFELWYIKGDDAPVSMGVIPVDQRSRIALSPDAQAKFAAGTTLAVTLEQKGGSPTGAPQGPIVAAGKAIAI